ncbi:Asp-tRNA(Asn)/Glu-tRNA(Gln) amidotransferase A subunit family amidase [Rhodoferax ferrireducens]|uniref:Asp-tRNA(Asn)/Glu-tRNA(Gln) amidotransferase A subunit family amidase n=1 Tax=Rhodoferax ferrireducens TaxID=192843 RepID=A0ABU2CFG9_9BURK|nr:amidase [Rhodoferax ferrireducens]MDR7380077.1 Asp-tRNA(Asn)/Glu-tRNA(Gln) amidotransferase A subunit family amidase [Rhodoferax ferrireducens]
MDSSLPETSAVELRRLIGTRQLSPVELMDACIARIEALNPAINAICATDFDRARETARQAEAQVMRGAPLGPLYGLPLGVKDLQDTAGLLTTYGNVGLRGNVPTADNLLVARLRAAGAIVTAKTNVPDMGAGANSRNPVWGATGNPFNPALNAGGSSGGSAAALAADLLPLCTGSDTGGSLRIPAALCGVVGLRPSPGLVANDARPLGWSVISVLGPMGRTVADTALQFAASVGPDPRDPLSYPVDASQFWPLKDIDLSRLRVGTTEDFGICIVDPEIRRVFRQRVEAIRPLVAQCEPVDLQLGDADRAFDVLRAESFVAAFADTFRNAPETLGPNVRANVEMAAAITLADRAWAHLEQTRIQRRFAKAFEQYDLILAPVTPVSPFPWTELFAGRIDGQDMRNYYHWLGLTYVVTLATNPALSLPCGTDEHGMPFGLQMVGRLHGDAQLLSAAQALEQVFAASPTLCRPRPDLQALAQARPELKSIVTHPPLHGEPGSFPGGRTAV